MKNIYKITVKGIALLILAIAFGNTAKAQEMDPNGASPMVPVKVMSAPANVDKAKLKDAKAAKMMPSPIVSGNRASDINAYHASLDKWLENNNNRKMFSQSDAALYKAGRFDELYDNSIKNHAVKPTKKPLKNNNNEK